MMNKLMKKMAIIFGAATISIAATSVTASAYTQYVNNDIGLNVRVRPDKSSASLGGFDRGDAVDVIGEVGDGWVKINYYGQIAYVRNCLSDYSPYDRYYDSNYDNDCDGAYEPQYESGYFTVSVPSGYLALRTSPEWTDDDSNVKGELYNGDQFRLIQDCGQYWYGYAVDTGDCGYVNADYLY